MTFVYKNGDRVTDRNVHSKRRGVVLSWTRDGRRRKYRVRWDGGVEDWYWATDLELEARDG